MSSSNSRFDRQSFWESHINAWQSSGLSKARYCREHDLSYQQFIYWAPKSGQLVKAQASKLLPVTITQQTAAPELQIRLPNGAVISGISEESVALVSALITRL